MAALLVSPLSLADRRSRAAEPGVGTVSAAAPRPFAAPQEIAGDSATLVGTGQAEAGDGFAEAQSEVNEKAVGLRAGMLVEQMPEQEEHEEISAEASLAQGPQSPAAPIEPPTEPDAGPGLGLATGLPAQSQAPNDLTILKSHNITSSEVSTGQRSVVHEPTAINLDNAVFYTANWYAAKSANGGNNFTYINPATFFPSVNGGFCCDQVTAYAPTQDMALWGVQYVKDSNTGTFRLARAIGSAGIANNSWVYWDFTPQNVGFANGNWFDYPSLTVGSNYVYITSNVFRTSDNAFTGSVIMRIPLSALAAGTSLNYNYYSSTTIGTMRTAEGSGTTAYFAAFANSSQMRVHRWPESGSSVLWDDVQLNSFTFLSSGGVATSPDGTNWAARADSRPLAAYVAGGIIGVMFMAKQDATFPYPYTIHARFNESTRALVSQGQIWHNKFAWLYPSAMPNASGHLAGTLQIGGGAAADGFPYPGTQIWISDDVQPGTTTIGGVHSLSSSNAGPSNNAWGDYFGVRQHKVYTNTWVSSSFSLQGGQTGSSVVPNYTWFGREKNGPGTTCPPSSAISYNQTVGGTLATTDCLLSGGNYYDGYTFSGSAGQQIAVSMSSSAFDTYLYLLGPSGNPVAEDDDGGGGLNSRIPAGSSFLTLPSNGTYTIRASSFSPGSTGAYSLTLTLNTPPPSGLQYYPLPTPVRLLDTRAGTTACDVPGAPLTAGVARTENARTTCTGIPATAQAIIGNATVVNNAGAPGGFVTLYPNGASLPTASNLNYVAGQIVPNAFTVKLGSDGAFNVYASSGTHFIVDIAGYYAPPGTGGLYYHPLPTPVRLLDTRAGTSACDVPGAPLSAGVARTENARIACTGIPAAAQAIVGNATVVNNAGAPGGFVTLYPSGTSLPTASNLNYAAGQIIPNSFTVTLSAGGAFNIYASSSTHFIVDVAGYYSTEQTDANGTGLLFNPLTTPVRLLDTRAGTSACDVPGAPLTAGAARTENARTTCTGIPAAAQAIVGNATVVNNAGAPGGFITLYPDGASLPTVSNLNYVAGQIVPNAFTVRLGTSGAFNIYASSATHFITDIAGYYAP
jgi:hypothetical protein